MNIRKTIAVFQKQMEDTLKNKAVLIQFIMFPFLAVIMKNSIKIEGMPENYFVTLFASMYLAMAPITSMASIIAVSGGGEVSPNTACREKCKALLKRRNYRLVYEDMIVMPSNFGTQAEKRLNLELIQVLPHKVEKIVTSILSGEKKTIRPKALDRILAPLGMGEQVGARFFGRFIHASKSCNQCGGCVRNCPRKNIQMKDGQPVFGFRCVWCMKCIYGCPRKALMPRFLKFCVLNDGYDIRKMSKEAGATKFDKKQPYPDNLAWQGVVDYLKKD